MYGHIFLLNINSVLSLDCCTCANKNLLLQLMIVENINWCKIYVPNMCFVFW